MGTRRRTPDDNGDGSDGNENRIGEGRREAKKTPCGKRGIHGWKEKKT